MDERAKKLWQFIQRYDAHILSAYSSNDGNSSLQNEVVTKNTSIKRGRIHLVKREQKQQFAMDGDKPCVLIDDYIKNIKEWK